MRTVDGVCLAKMDRRLQDVKASEMQQFKSSPGGREARIALADSNYDFGGDLSSW